MHNQILERAMALRMLLSKSVTGRFEEGDDENYKILRSEFLKNQSTKAVLPSFVISCRILDDFWPFIKKRFSTYEERREFIREEFEPLLCYLEDSYSSLFEDSISTSFETFDCDSAKHLWEKALNRKNTDPDGAITVARSLLESACKQILTERETPYNNSYDLPRLYKLTSQGLNLAPQLHNEDTLKQILGGIHTVINGFASLRNELGDAHGKPKGGYRAGKRHAELAVNLAGSITSFLIQTHQESITISRTNKKQL